MRQGLTYEVPVRKSGLPASPAARRRTAARPVAVGYYGQSVAILNLDGVGGLDPLMGSDFYTATHGLLQRLTWAAGPPPGNRNARATAPAHLTAGETTTGTTLKLCSVGSTLPHD